MTQLKTEFAVPHQVYFDAKHYVEQKRVPFFDFFRNCCYGFIQTGEHRGYFTHLVITESGELDCHCKCREAEGDEVCGHGFALYLRMLNWPFEKMNLSTRFENDPLVRFIKTCGRNVYQQTLSSQSNPAFVLPREMLDERMIQYWQLIPGDPSMRTKRDIQCLDKAKRLTRSKQEQTMIRKGVAPARVLFEESPLYKLCKVIFYLKLRTDLAIDVELMEDHQVQVRVLTKKHQVLTWTMRIDVWLKGANNDWDFWQRFTRFQVHRQSLPITYRIQFTEGNDLWLEPMVEVAPEHEDPAARFIPIDEVVLPGIKSLYYHPDKGYFRLQAGLSHFEMEYSTPGKHHVDHQDVKKFLKSHRETLQTLDRTLIDDSLFGEVVVEHFECFTITLLNFEDARFRFTMTARLGGIQYNEQELRTLFEGKGRYRKISGKLFDATGYDGVYLKPLYEAGDELGTIAVSDLFRVIAFFRNRLTVNTNDLTAGVFQSLKDYRMPDLPDLSHTRLTLRKYQQAGYEWLYFLRSFGLGGLLCDQMGLGKTHQGMALLASILTEREKASILVVAPASVVYHWLDKLRTFCPGIKATSHHGSERNAVAALRNYNVLVSTYGTLRNDIDHFGDHVFDLVIYDEIQNLKNKSTKAYQAFSRLKGLCKIGLTGTPIENHISELKSLMDLVFPGYLGSDVHFKRYFADPIEQRASETAVEAVRAMVNPFTLRRNKSEVLLELPEKTEDVRTLELGEYERELYRETKASGKQRILEAGKEQTMLHAFTLIDKLKQLCNHPALYFKNTDYEDYPSAKWDTFRELLTESLESGEKIVVFTQYLGMIDIFKKYLDQEGIRYASITGKTQDRAREQERFQTDPDCRVFLGTVRAAGVGIDLTAASILIHYDRWWNAAREEQATDRVHRIGQKKAVQIYKFRAINTVEERIDKIIESKRKLLEDVVSFDPDNMRKVFGMDELLEILA